MALTKLFHLLFLFIWIGSLLTLTRFSAYLPREEAVVQKRFAYLLRRLYLYVDLPAMLLALSLGVVLFIGKGVDFSQGWLHMKLTFAALLVVCDVVTGRMVLREKQGRGRSFKVLHGCTALCLLALLSAVYVVKNRVTTDSSLAKNEESRMMLPLDLEKEVER